MQMASLLWLHAQNKIELEEYIYIYMSVRYEMECLI